LKSIKDSTQATQQEGTGWHSCYVFENVSGVLFLGQAYSVVLDLLLVGHALADSAYTQTAQREVPFVKRLMN